MYKAKILANLKAYGGKWVNPFIALSGIFGEDGSMGMLEELVREGKVDKDIVTLGNDKFGQEVRAPLYRLAPDYSMLNIPTTHLTVIK